MKICCKLLISHTNTTYAFECREGRVISEPFFKLPSKKELPDYYEVIKRPVDIRRILARIEDNKVSLAAFWEGSALL